MKKFITVSFILLTAICHLRGNDNSPLRTSPVISAEAATGEETVQSYLKLIVSNLEQGKPDTALALYCSLLDVVKDNKGEGLMLSMYSTHIFDRIFPVAYSNNRSSAKELADRYLEYTLEDMESQSKKDGISYATNKELEIIKIGYVFLDIDDTEFAARYLEDAVHMIERDGIDGKYYDDYDKVLEVLSNICQYENNDVRTAAQMQHRIFKNTIGRYGHDSDEAKITFMNYKLTVESGYSVTAEMTHASTEDPSNKYCKDVDTAIGCLHDFRDNCLGIEKEYGSDYLESLLDFELKCRIEYCESIGETWPVDDWDKYFNHIERTYILEPYIYMFFADIDKALESADQAFDYFSSHSPEVRYYVYEEIAVLFNEYNHPNISRDIYQFAMRTADEKEEVYAETMRLDLARYYYRTGNLLEAYELAMLTADDDLCSFHSLQNYCEANFIVAGALYSNFEFEEAIIYAERALDAVEGRIPKVKDPGLYEYRLSTCKDEEISRRYETASTYRGNLADMYVALGDYDRAASILEDGIRTYQGQGHEITNATIERLGHLKLQTGDYESAIGYYRRAYDDWSRKKFSTESVVAPLSFLYMKQGDIDSTRYFTRRLSDDRIAEFVSRTSGLTESARYDYWDVQGNSYILEYVGGITSETNGELNDVLYDTALRHKGFLLNYSNTIARNILESDYEELIYLYHTFKRAQVNGEANAATLENECMYLYSLCPEIYNRYTLPSWRDVKASLGKKDVAIEFVRCQEFEEMSNTYKALILTADSEMPVLVTLCNERDLETLAGQFQERATNEMLTTLHDLIWRKIEPHIKKCSDVYFSPYNILCQLNLEAAIDGKGRIMSEKYQLHRVSSTALIQKNNKFDFDGGSLFGGLEYDSRSTAVLDEMGFDTSSLTRGGYSYLQGSLDEVLAIYSMFEGKNLTTSLYTGKDGTEASFKALSAKKSPIVHIATHGFYFNSSKEMETENEDMFNYLNSITGKTSNSDSSIPLMKRSGLLFSGVTSTLEKGNTDGVEDNILFSDEIAGLDLSTTRLLVLSACQTGLGKIDGDGVYGLQRAFKLAGVETIIMSLWEVDDDATNLMMTSLYEKLLEGESKRDSFNYAVNRVRNKYDDPTCWAAFIMLD